jgi:arylsulfatase
VPAGTECDVPLAFWDVLPTLAEVVGADAPKGIDGISFVPALLGKGQPRHGFLYWEFPSYGGQQAVTAGDWKAVRQNLAKKVVKTELYNLATDPNETTDVAAKHPDVVAKLEALMKVQHTPSAAFPLQGIDKK